MTLTDAAIKNIIKNLINGKDYRIEVITLIDATFLQYVISFFKQIVEAKLANEKITVDWYKKEFLNSSLPSRDIAINSGLNKKTITNMFNSGSREVVVDAASDHYDELYKVIEDLVKNDDSIDITLTIKLNGVSVDLNVSESLIIINTLAVKRAELRGGLWSSAGKKVEGPLMLVLCKLFNVSERNYKVKLTKNIKLTDDELEKNIFIREVDFYLINRDGDNKCEVKLMGKGNPESADAVIARESKVFVADKLSDTNKRQLNSLNVEWLELRSDGGYKKFNNILTKLRIPHDNFSGNLDKKIDEIFIELFNN